MLALLLLVLTLGWAMPVRPAEILKVDVAYDSGIYTVDFQVLVQAHLERVRAVISDYPNFVRLSPIVREVHVVDLGHQHWTRINLKLRPCLWIFCKDLKKVTDIERISENEFIFTTVPAVSDFYAAVEYLTLFEVGGATRLRYWAQLMPKFFVPPFIGPWVVRRQIESELTGTAARLEQQASAPAS